MSGITDAELASLRDAKNEDEWSAACDAIKKAHKGYPHDWWAKVKLSGLMDQVAKKWGRPDAFELKAIPLTKEELDSGKS